MCMGQPAVHPVIISRMGSASPHLLCICVWLCCLKFPVWHFVAGMATAGLPQRPSCHQLIQRRYLGTHQRKSPRRPAGQRGDAKQQDTLPYLRWFVMEASACCTTRHQLDVPANAVQVGRIHAAAEEVGDGEGTPGASTPVAVFFMGYMLGRHTENNMQTSNITRTRLSRFLLLL